MSNSHARLSVLFENPFWIALYERQSGGKYEVCKITFGAELKDHEVYGFFLGNDNRLRFGPTLEAAEMAARKINPKRLQRRFVLKQQKRREKHRGRRLQTRKNFPEFLKNILQKVAKCNLLRYNRKS